MPVLDQNPPVCVWPLEAELGESPVWHNGALWFVDIKGQRVHRYEPVSNAKRSWFAPEPIGFLQPTVAGDFIAGLKSGLHRFDPASGDFASMLPVEPELPDNRLNDATVDAEGHLWFGTMDDRESEATGCLYKLDPDGHLSRHDGRYVVTNGPALSPDGRTLYHTDSAGRQILAFDRAADGSLSAKRVFASTEPDVHPDGPTVDADGRVWTGLFNGWAIRCLAANGRSIRDIRLPVSRVTKAAFGGPQLTTLYITTAWTGLSSEQRREEPLAGALFAVELDRPGLPAHLVKHGLR